MKTTLKKGGQTKKCQGILELVYQTIEYPWHLRTFTALVHLLFHPELETSFRDSTSLETPSSF